MSLLGSYQQLFKRADFRKKMGDQRLARLARQRDDAEEKKKQIEQKIAFQRQLILAQTTGLGGTTLKKEAITSWLRRGAVMKRQAQTLTVDLHNQTDVCLAHQQSVAQQSMMCTKFERKKQKYTGLVCDERKKQHLKRLQTEETDIEERAPGTTLA